MAEEEGNAVVSSDEGSEFHSGKPNIVRLLRSEPLTTPELKVESEQPDQGNNLFWPAIAVAFMANIVASWLWGKWKERQNQKGKPDK